MRTYLHKTEDGKLVATSFKHIRGGNPVRIKDLYRDKVPIYAPWLIENSKDRLKNALQRTIKSVILENVKHIYIPSNDPLLKTMRVPEPNIIKSGCESICPPQLEDHKITKNIELKPINTNKPKKQKMTLKEAQEKLKKQVKDI